MAPFQGPWWLRPQLPELNAEGDDFCDYTPLPKPNPTHLDVFFWTEHIQLLRGGGLRTYESQILQELEPYTPRLALPAGLSGYRSDESSENEEDMNGTSASGNNSNDDYTIDNEPDGASLFPIHPMLTAAPLPWMDRDFVEVDETKWFKLFRRERWASYSNQDPGQLSVDIDDDKDWGKLSRVIEIANRILSEAVDQEWLLTILNPKARDTRGPVTTTDRTKSWNNTVVHRAVPVPPHARLSRKQACKALDDVAEYIFWGFHMPDEYAGVTGKTSSLRRNDGRWFRFMTLNLMTMEPVFQMNTSGDPEGRQTAVGMAHVMLHELAHSLSGLFFDKMPKSKKNSTCRSYELFFKEERWAEAGYSFETAVFGTTAKNHWAGWDGRIQYLGMRGMSPETCESSPHWRYDGWALEDPFLDVPLGIPAIVPHAMATSDFWEVHVKKYGYPSLRWTWVCEGRSEASNGEVQMRPAKIMDQPYKYSRYSELNRGMKAVAQKLRKRRLDLKRLRPWYAKEYAFWSRTLYAETTLRSALVYLAETLRGRSFQQEATANESIEKLLKPHNRLSDLETVLPEKTRTSRMFYHAMGFLGQATLPVRRGTVTYTDSDVVEYPDRLRPALRRGFAGDAALVDQLVASGKAWADKKRTKTLYNNSEPSHDRELCMSNAHLAFRRWQVLGFFSASIVRDFEIEWQLLRRQMDQAPFEDVQLDWSPGTWPVLRHYFGETDHQTSAFFSAGELMEQKGEGVDADIPVGAIARPAIPSAPSASAPAPWIPYYNTGEVGDHQRLNSVRKWFCVWDGREMAIYDMTDLLVGVSWTKEARAHVTAPCTNPLCRMVRVDTMNQVWLDRFTTEQPIGYVARVRMKEDVRINDGKDGRPRWVMAGEDVYDVTNVELPPESQDLESIFAGSSHEDPVAEAVNLGYHPDVIHETLRPYWIGQVYKKGERRSRVHYVFTESDVRWHTTRETGIYIIIRGKVYDFTKFIDVHPGGSSIIAQIAGTDATAAWDKFHGSLYTDFPFDVHAQLDNLEIGRVVEERIQTAMTLSPNEICIRNCIYSKDRSDAHEEKKIIDLLDGYWGSDGTAEMEKPDAPEVYIRLWDRPWLIVAKLGTPRDKLPYMSPKVLGKMDGKERPGGFNESWVSNGHVVYNITSLVRCSSPISIVEKLKLRAGSRLEPAVAEDRALISFLENSCSHRIIGLLRAPKHGLTSLEKPVAWKTSYRRTPATKPKPAPQTGGSVSTAATPTPAPAPFTVRPLYPLRKKRKKTNDTGAGYPHPQGINLWLQNVAIDEPMGEPMDESPDDPMDDPIGDPMDMSRIAARTVLKKMGFPAQPGRETADHERKKGGW